MLTLNDAPSVEEAPPAPAPSPNQSALRPRYPGASPRTLPNVAPTARTASVPRPPQPPRAGIAAAIDLARLSLPSELSEAEAKAFRQRVSSEDPAAWHHMERFTLLHRLFYLGIAKLAHRQQIATAFRKECERVGYDPPAPPPPPPPPPHFASASASAGGGGGLVSPSLGAIKAPVFEAGPGAPPGSPRVDGVDTPRLDGDHTRDLVRRALLLPSMGTQYERRNGRIGVRKSGEMPAVFRWTSRLGECGGDHCSCNRLSAPWVRAGFRNLVVRRTVEQLSGRTSDRRAPPPSPHPPPVRYVSVGCGHLLTDFEILCGLQLKGLTIASIVLCDIAYRFCISPHPKHKQVVFGNDHASALQAVADFFPDAHVAAFGDFDALLAAAKDAPSKYGRATTFVKCDSEEVSSHSANRTAQALLVKGGLAFHLANDGHGASAWQALGEVRAAFELNQRHKFPALTKPTRRCFECDEEAPSDRPDGRSARDTMRAVDIGAREGGAPLCTARELTSLLPTEDLRVYRVVARQAPVHMGDASSPSTSAVVIGSREEGDEVLGYPPVAPRDGRMGSWVRLSRHDPHRTAWVRMPDRTRQEMSLFGFGGPRRSGDASPQPTGGFSACRGQRRGGALDARRWLIPRHRAATGGGHGRVLEIRRVL